jgi:hypothetical protein
MNRIAAVRIAGLAFASYCFIPGAHAMASEDIEHLDGGRFTNGPMFNQQVVDVGALNPDPDVDGLFLEGLKKAGVSVPNVILRDGELVGSGPLRVGGEWFVGATIEATEFKQQPDFPSKKMTLTITKYTANEYEDKLGLTLRSPTYKVTTPSGRSICVSVDFEGNVEDQPVVLLPGRWDLKSGAPRPTSNNLITFGCEHNALGKAVRILRYYPSARKWKKICSLSGKCGYLSVDLTDAHQAATRMIRADYNGDGTSYTKPLMSIDVADRLAFQTTSQPWEHEAVWNKNGAVCVDRFRVSDLTPAISPPPCDVVGLSGPDTWDNGDNHGILRNLRPAP